MNNNRIYFILSLSIISLFIATGLLEASFPNVEMAYNSQESALQQYEYGYDYYKKGLFEKSEASLLQALRIEPNLIKAHYWLGKLYREKGQLQDAIFHWEEVDRLKKLIKNRRIALSFRNNNTPSKPQTVKTTKQKKIAQDAFEKATLFLDKGHWDGAEVEMRKAVALYPGNRNYLIKLARLLWDKDEQQASVKFYRDLMTFNFVNYKDFCEGMDRIIEANMLFVATPLIFKQKLRFEHYPKFAKYQKLLKPIETFSPVSAGKVVRRMKGQVLLNIGFTKGLNLSDEFSLSLRTFSPGSPVVDDDTGNVIGRTADKISADLMITKVYRQSSWALIRKEFGSGVKAGDLIEVKKTNY